MTRQYPPYRKLKPGKIVKDSYVFPSLDADAPAVGTSPDFEEVPFEDDIVNEALVRSKDGKPKATIEELVAGYLEMAGVAGENDSLAPTGGAGPAPANPVAKYGHIAAAFNIDPVFTLAVEVEISRTEINCIPLNVDFGGVSKGVLKVVVVPGGAMDTVLVYAPNVIAPKSDAPGAGLTSGRGDNRYAVRLYQWVRSIVGKVMNKIVGK